MKKVLSDFSWILTIILIVALIVLIAIALPYQIGLGDKLETLLQQAGIQLQYGLLLRIGWILAGCLVVNIVLREKVLKE
ncbi:MAG: hypothetical protein IKB13_07565 [Clostridia bacterium]|nr:hypothetical protein [Clostridia bacterium]